MGCEANGIKSDVILKKRKLWSTLNVRIFKRQSRLFVTTSIRRRSEYDFNRKVRLPLQPIVQLIHGYPTFIDKLSSTLQFQKAVLLPACCCWSSLERPFYVRGDPATVEISILSLDVFAINVTSINTPRIECYVIFDGFVSGRRIVVAPRSLCCNFFSYLQRIVRCQALELTVTLMV